MTATLSGLNTVYVRFHISWQVPINRYKLTNYFCGCTTAGYKTLNHWSTVSKRAFIKATAKYRKCYHYVSYYTMFLTTAVVFCKHVIVVAKSVYKAGYHMWLS